MQKPILLLALIVTGLTDVDASAQNFIPHMNEVVYTRPSYATEESSTLATSVSRRVVDQAIRASAPAPSSTNEFLYRPSRERRRINLQQFAEKSRAVDPEGATELAAFFKATDIIGQLQTALRPYGLRVDNVADAYSVWWINAWQATRGHNNEVDRDTIEAVRAQAARALTSAPEFGSATDATKQEMAEALLIQAALIDSSVEQSKGKPDQMKAVGRAVAQGARGMGLDLNKMTLTEDGFRPTRETGALDVKGEPAALAATTAATDPEPPYLLMAAAGGAGLGGALLLGRVMSRRG